ncbi:MAG: response regulator transcription factor [Synergistaceae bacterium]|nr:response regulator transcription factor [Synergistaceae bacterium]
MRHNKSKLSLSERELQILILVARGFSDKEIAKKLFVSKSTVNNHLLNILKKLNTKNRVQAVIEAIKHDLLTLAEI